MMRVKENGIVRDVTDEEAAEMQKQAEKAKIEENSRPLTVEEVSRMFIAQNINTVITDDATASRAVEFHPVLKQDKVQTEKTPLVRVGTRINWNGKLKRAAVDLWDTVENNPDNAPTLWEDIEYRDGYRIIPDSITVGKAFAKDEYGWWGDVLYRSKVADNIYTPAQYQDNWETV